MSSKILIEANKSPNETRTYIYKNKSSFVINTDSFQFSDER